MNEPNTIQTGTGKVIPTTHRRYQVRLVIVRDGLIVRSRNVDGNAPHTESEANRTFAWALRRLQSSEV